MPRAPAIRTYTLSLSRSQVSPTLSSDGRVVGAGAEAGVLAAAPVRYPFTPLSLPLIPFPCTRRREQRRKIGKDKQGVPWQREPPEREDERYKLWRWRGQSSTHRAPAICWAPCGRWQQGGSVWEQVCNSQVRLSTLVLTCRVCAFEASTGVVTLVLWAYEALQDSISRSSSGQSFGLALQLALAHTCTTPMRCVSTRLHPSLSSLTDLNQCEFYFAVWLPRQLIAPWWAASNRAVSVKEHWFNIPRALGQKHGLLAHRIGEGQLLLGP